MIALKDILIVSGDEDTFYYLARVFTKLLSTEDKLKVDNLKKHGADLAKIRKAIQ